MTRIVALVSGRVQGVGYRYFVRKLAASWGLAGCARNLPDGRVEVVLEGPDDPVRAAVASLDGPNAPGHVRDIAVRTEADRGETGFTVA